MFSNISRNQLLRIGIGLAVLILVLIIYVPRLLFTYSISAVVSARTVMIHSPIAGTVIDGPPQLGTNLEAGEPIIEIENKNYDKSKLDALLIEEKSEQERMMALQTEQKEMEALREQVSKSNQKYMDSLIERIKIEIDRTDLKLKEAEATVLQTKSENESKSVLGKKGYVASNVVDASKYSHARAIKVQQQIEQDLKRLQSTLKSLENGVFVNHDGHTDASYQGQRMDEISLRLSDLKARLEEITSRHETTMKTRQAEELRIASLTRTTVKMPSKGTIWRIFSNKGGYIDVNSPVVEIADCSNLFMDVTLPERYFHKVKPGQKVRIRLTGDDKTISGEVVSVRGGSIDPRSADMMVGESGIRRQWEIEVIVKINPADLPQAKGNFCHLGRNGEVIFDGI